MTSTQPTNWTDPPPEGTECPRCGSDDCFEEELESETTDGRVVILQAMLCNDCGKVFR